MKLDSILAWTLLAYLPLFSACGGSAEGDAAGKAKKTPQKVAYAIATQEEVTDFVELVGRLSADESVVIQSRVSGFLLKTHFVDGQQVEHRTVETGDRRDSMRVILSGVQPQESVVVAGMQFIQPRMKVALVLQDQ